MKRALLVALVVLAPVIFTHLLPGVVAYGWLVLVPVLAVVGYLAVAFGISYFVSYILGRRFADGSLTADWIRPELLAFTAVAFVFSTLSCLGATVWIAWLYNGSGYIGAMKHDW